MNDHIKGEWARATGRTQSDLERLEGSITDACDLIDRLRADRVALVALVETLLLLLEATPEAPAVIAARACLERFV